LSSPLIARYEPANAIQPLRRVADRGMRVDRAMAIGAQAYTALIPLLIVYASLLPRADNEDFADTMIKEFELTPRALLWLFVISLFLAVRPLRRARHSNASALTIGRDSGAG
jgi:hypothetical protein